MCVGDEFQRPKEENFKSCVFSVPVSQSLENILISLVCKVLCLSQPSHRKSAEFQLASLALGLLTLSLWCWQTIRFPNQNDFSLEVCTCVCRIQEDSPAHLSGLQTGDILACINGVSIEGFGHKQIVDLIKSSGNYLRLETVNGALFLRKMELETKLQALKQELHQRWGELRALLARERLLLHGTCPNSAAVSLLLSFPSPEGEGLGWERAFVPAKPRFSSESSSRSRLSSMTLGSEDSFYQGSAFEDSAADSLSRQSSVDDDCVFRRDGEGAAGRSSLRRHRSISLASSGSMSPLWESSGCSSSFGTLPRKSRRPSVRKHLLKFIPGFHRAVEEEESRV
uniref:Cytohesin 1 interacting protein n=1 Tax=Catharus ustulatus TaxID=91951 RepID=A0A8C3TPI5_CATUS